MDNLEPTSSKKPNPDWHSLQQPVQARTLLHIEERSRKQNHFQWF